MPTVFFLIQKIIYRGRQIIKPATANEHNRGGPQKVSAAVNRLTAAGKAARCRKATIYRDFPAAADRFARRGKPKTAAADKHFVVVKRLGSNVLPF